MTPHTDLDIKSVLRLAFGQAMPTTPIALPPEERGMAFTLEWDRFPQAVLLLRYSPQEQARALYAFQVMQALREMNFPVPAIYYLGWSPRTRYTLMLTELVEGQRHKGLPHAFFFRVGSHFAQTLAHLHTLPWEVHPDLLIRPLRFAFDELSRQVFDLNMDPLPEILGWLRARINDVNEMPHTVLHGDYTLYNILADYTAVTGVLNWENASLADPRFDVGHTCATLGAFGADLSDQFLHDYEAAYGQPVQDSEFWEVMGALRLLVGIGSTVTQAHASKKNETQDLALPMWTGLLSFVKQRTGLEF
jgi:aminoglycoside phosphotransferase (APT) family kinase protein